MIFKSIVKPVAARNGFTADFSPKPLMDKPGSGMHINFSVRSTGGENCLSQAIAGIMDKIFAITAFLNPYENSYACLGGSKGGKPLIFQERTYAVLLVSAAQNFNSSIMNLLPMTDYWPVNTVDSVAAAMRAMLERSYDIVIINAPLPDDFSSRLAIDVCTNSGARRC